MVEPVLTSRRAGSASIDRGAYFAKYHLFYPNFHASLGSLMRNQELARHELERLNWQKRKRLFTYAFEKVPIYRKKHTQAGLHPSDIRSPEDFLQKLDRITSGSSAVYQTGGHEVAL